jgi:twitching motility two-component system response regulator PilH
MANLLVVDDDRDVAEPLLLFLEMLGHTVRYCGDGEVGLIAVREKFPDLIFLDVDMPKLNGPGMVYRLIVEDSGRENIPLLLVSGVDNLTYIAKQIGTPYFVAKPFNLSELERIMLLALDEKRPPRPPDPLGREV